MTEREKFEKWINGKPYSLSVRRWPTDPAAPRPGEYRDYAVEIAWRAWQERARVARGGVEPPHSGL